MTKQELLDDIDLFLKLSKDEKNGSFGQWGAEILYEVKKLLAQDKK